MAWAEKHGSGFRVRYRLPDGSLTSETGFVSLPSARDRAADVESDQRRGTFVDPSTGRMSLREWVQEWEQAHDVSLGTWAKYQAHLRNHILPRFGELPLSEISRMAVKAWVKQLRRRLAESTVADVVSQFSMILGEAVEEGLIGTNPCRRLRVGVGAGQERPHAAPWQIDRIAGRLDATHRLLVMTGAYTGLRWGELAGLRWTGVDMAAGTIRVDARFGALHEIGGRVELGPPKTPASVRHVQLPPFLRDSLRAHRGEQDHEHVFTGTDGGLLRRSNFRDRFWVPAVAGLPRRGWAPLLPGFHFHDLRHTHKTWLIEDNVPEILQHKRLGHRMRGVAGIYSHVTQDMIDRMLVGLQQRWELSTANTTETDSQNTYRNRDHVMIGCSQNAPSNAENPAGDNHRRGI